ncbi:peptide-methionine (S)-S-oxide reductase MsrA [Rhodovulum sp. YNF3179]|uniref:peptide-methionine (S)-S-oxide reductase MsrA n=1 Tax=Rhodovulum sp. YNF3179 TaxID=3425127 RepID=UPI003D335EA2
MQITPHLNTLKSAALVAAMTLAVLLNCERARADDIQTAIFAGGCFWCVEADFDKVDGVKETVSGYTGGDVKNPSYKQVTRGGTGHYEAVRITFDADTVSYRRLVDLFFRSVDPTDAGGQFCDRGESYRTAVFALDPAQAQAAKAAKAEARAELGQEIVTPILDAGTFWKAEDYHQNYYQRDDRVLTRFGWIPMSKAYDRYRDACGRDQRVRQLWGADAPFVKTGS